MDTNIVFSALMNANNAMGEILMNLQDELEFFAPELLRIELERYSSKLCKVSKLSSNQLLESSTRLLEKINLISEEAISNSSWEMAYELTKDVDEDDTPFVALSIELKAPLWTGDKKLSNGLLHKGVEIIVTTTELNKFLGDK